MKWLALAVSTAVFVGGVTGCGGGGGGAPILPITLPISVSVTVNGNAVNSSNDHYSVRPGDKITVTPNQSADWTMISDPDGSISLRNPEISAAKWSAQLVNTTGAAGVLTVSAKATANAAFIKDVVFNVAAGDARNGIYKVFSTNGTKPTLSLNFDTMSYTLTDSGGTTLSDVFVPDPSEVGAYVFKSVRNTPQAVTTRFRLAGDTVVGTFPFAVTATLASNVYTSQPFVASRALVTTQSALDGVYNRLGLDRWILTHDKTLHNSEIRQVQVTAGGTVYLLCDEPSITSIASCPAASLRTYNVSAGIAPDEWSITNVADSSDTDTFSVARVAGKNVYLAAGPYPKLPNSMVFRIGLAESATWPVTNASGGDTAWNWGSLNFDATTYSTVRIAQDGTTSGFVANLSSPSPTIMGLRTFVGPDAGNYFAMQDGALSVVIGAPSTPPTAPFDAGDPVSGYLQIGLVH
ncbi:hypothetical protein ABIC94_002853 [Variovorax paradoxus]|uniref:hypothetical protein n=1 Tax=Variovorax paradoxus TaxID=34073 RepID=UPI00339117D4